MTEVTSRIIRDRAIKPSAKLIYLYLAAAYREIYVCPVACVSFAQLAKDTGFSESTVRRSLKHLEELGLIRVESGSNKIESWLNVDLLLMDAGYSLLRQIATAGGA